MYYGVEKKHITNIATNILDKGQTLVLPFDKDKMLVLSSKCSTFSRYVLPNATNICVALDDDYNTKLYSSESYIYMTGKFRHSRILAIGRYGE